MSPTAPPVATKFVTPVVSPTMENKEHFDNLFLSIGEWFTAMDEDLTNKRFREDWARLTKNLLIDSQGSLKFKPELWSDIRKVIVPTLVDKVCIALLLHLVSY